METAKAPRGEKQANQKLPVELGNLTGAVFHEISCPDYMLCIHSLVILKNWVGASWVTFSRTTKCSLHWKSLLIFAMWFLNNIQIGVQSHLRDQ